MPHNEPDATDPMSLTGVEVPAAEEEVVEMARSFAEEFAAGGWSAERLLTLFRNPFYAGPHLAWVQLGETRVRGLIDEAVLPWRKAHA